MAQRASFTLWISSRPSQGRRPRRPAHAFSMPPAGVILRPRARVTFGRSPKSDQKACLKPQVSRLPARLTAPKPVTAYPAKTKTLHIAVHRIAHRPLSAAAPTSRTEIPCPTILKNGRPNGPHLHLPPLAASARFDDRLKPVEPPTSAAHHVSGSEGRPMADSLRNLFPLHQKRPKGNPKTIGFWRRSFPRFFRCWKKWGRRRDRRRKHSAGSKKRA